MTTRPPAPASAASSAACYSPRASSAFAAIDALAAEAERRGLTDEILEEELAAYNAERRDASPPA